MKAGWVKVQRSNSRHLRPNNSRPTSAANYSLSKSRGDPLQNSVCKNLGLNMSFEARNHGKMSSTNFEGWSDSDLAP